MGAQAEAAAVKCREQRIVVQPEVRRSDHGDPGHAETGSVLGESHGVGGRLGSTVHRDLQAPGGCLHEELGHAAALFDGEQDPLTRGAEGEQPVQSGPGQEVDERVERRFVELATTVPERRRRCRKRAGDHRPLAEKCW